MKHANTTPTSIVINFAIKRLFYYVTKTM